MAPIALVWCLIVLSMASHMAALPEQFPSKVLGMNYDPNPIGYTQGRPPPQLYYDSDFFHASFAALWGDKPAHDHNPGRGDLKKMAEQGVNFVRLYNWNAERDHTPFLKESARLGISLALPISNYAFKCLRGDFGDGCTEKDVETMVHTMVAEAAPFACQVRCIPLVQST